MELTLILQPENQIAVSCDGQHSHTFELYALTPDNTIAGSPPNLFEDPVAFGSAVYQALFQKGSLAQQALEAGPKRISLVTETDDLQIIPWEYAHNGEDFLVLEVPFVRGLSKKEQIPIPDLGEIPVHMVAVPSNPLGEDIIQLNIAGEWLRLREIIERIPQQITLERANPPTLDSLRKRFANRQHRILHFMGHGGQHEGKAILFFENEGGGLEPVFAKDFALTVQEHVFLVTLNACVSATPGETELSNLAAALVKRQIPYALGMRFSIPDADALAFSRAFYTEIAAGTPIEVALFHARRSMMRTGKFPWVVGVPVLYTSLAEPAPGFTTPEGTPAIDEGQPAMDVDALRRAEGTFQGRVPELLALGEKLTGDKRPKLLTIHGGGGQGKTALAREAVERFAHAWPGGVWAISLENLPSRLAFATRLANFLGVVIDDLLEQDELERRLLNTLRQRRVLLVLDNAETLVEAVEQKEANALELVTFLRERISSTLAGLLVTSRYRLGWTGEGALELGGLTDEEGARLFRQSAPIRQVEIPVGAAQSLSRRVYGHPLALRLLGLAFDAVKLSLDDFTEQYEAHLVEARDKYRKESHRHHSLFASIDTSVAFLDEDLCVILSGLWIFEAPFLPKTAAEIFTHLAAEGSESAVEEAKIEVRQEQIIDQLHILNQRGLLVGERRTFRDGTLLTYRLLPTMRLYVREMEQTYPQAELQERFGVVYSELVIAVNQALKVGGALVWLADQARADIEHGMQHTSGETLGWYQNRWGWVLGRLGDRKSALRYLEVALETAQGRYADLELHVLNNMAGVFSATGQPEEALKLYNQALPIMREVGDRAGEATTLNNMAGVFSDTGQPEEALKLYNQALPIRIEVGDRAGEAITNFNMAMLLRDKGENEKAIQFLRDAVMLEQQVQHPDYQQDAAMLSEWEKALKNR